MFLQKGGGFVDIGYSRHHKKRLTTSEALTQQRLAQRHRIERRDVGAHGKPIHRGRCNQRHLAHARHSELQRTGNGCRADCKHVDVFANLLQTLFMLHTEMLLLVDDQQPEIGKVDRLSEESVCADDNIDIALLEAFLRRAQLLG